MTTTADAPPLPAFGARVRVSAYYSRAGAASAGRKTRKAWHRWEYSTPRHALYIGKRTLSDGYVEWWEEEGYAYTPERHFIAALVVFSERERPVLVPLDALEAA